MLLDEGQNHFLFELAEIEVADGLPDKCSDLSYEDQEGCREDASF